ncbi:TPA: TrkA family potassium uptake protein [Listeria monocytogenes]
MKEGFAVIGLGRFGGSICRSLVEQGMEVLAIDSDEERVNEYMSIATHAVIANSTDENALRQLGIRNFEHVIVAIGEDIQSSILTTLILKEMGVKYVTAKTTNDKHAKLLDKIGADRVVHPERDMGRRIAHYIVSKNMLDYLELSDEYSLVEISVSDPRFLGKSLVDLDFRNSFGVNIVGIKKDKQMIITPEANDVLHEGDILIVIGSDDDIERLQEKIQ